MVTPKYRYIRYSHHRLRPELKLSGRVAWLLVHRAADAQCEVAQLVAELLTSWAEAEIAAMGERQRGRFVRTIPYWGRYNRELNSPADKQEGDP